MELIKQTYGLKIINANITKYFSKKAQYLKKIAKKILKINLSETFLRMLKNCLKTV